MTKILTNTNDGAFLTPLDKFNPMFSKSFNFSCLQHIINLVWKSKLSFPCPFYSMNFNNDGLTLKGEITHY